MRQSLMPKLVAMLRQRKSAGESVPSVGEMRVWLGVKTAGSVYFLLNMMESRGVIRRVGPSWATFEIVPDHGEAGSPTQDKVSRGKHTDATTLAVRQFAMQQAVAATPRGSTREIIVAAAEMADWLLAGVVVHHGLPCDDFLAYSVTALPQEAAPLSGRAP